MPPRFPFIAALVSCTLLAGAWTVASQHLLTVTGAPSQVATARLEQLGQAGGEVHAVRVRSGMAYAAQDAHLAVLDIRNAAVGPRLLGTSEVFSARPVDLALDYDLAYMLVDDGLQIVNIADAARLRTVSSLEQADDVVFNPTSIALGSDLAFIAAVGLFVVDLADPARPRWVGDVDAQSGRFGPVAAQGHMAYAVQSDFDYVLRVIDAADPAQPRVRGSLPIPGEAMALTVADDTVFVATWGALLAVDVSDPDRPLEIGRFTLPSDRAGVVSASVSGEFAWLVVNGDTSSVVHLLNVANPIAMVEIGVLAMDQAADAVAADGTTALVLTSVSPDSHAAGQELRTLVATRTGPARAGAGLSQPAFTALAVSGDVVYAWQNGDELVAVDFSDPARARIGSPVSGIGGFWYAATVVGHYLIGAEGNAGVRVLDIADPLRPQPLALLPLGGEARYMAATARGTVVTASPEGLWAIGIDDPAHPRILGRDPVAQTAVGLAVVGEIAVTTRTDGMSDGKLHVTDLAVPTAPRAAGELAERFVRIVAGPGATVLTLRERGFSGSELVAVDVSQPDAPHIVMSFPIEGGGSHLTYVAGHAVSEYRPNSVGSVLVLVDIKDVTHPTLAGEAKFAGNNSALLPAGDRLLVNAYGGNVVLAALHTGANVDPSATPAASPRPTRTPESPTPAPGTPTTGGRPVFLPRLDNGIAHNKDDLVPVGQLGGPAWDVVTDGTTAFMGLGPRLQAFDMSAAGVARPLGVPLAFNDIVQGLALAGHTLYVAAGRDGVVIVDVSDPAAPRRIGGIVLAEPAQDVSWDGSHLYVAADRGGLKVLDVANPQRPAVIGSLADGPRWPIWRVIATSGYAFILSAPEYTDAAIVDVHDPTAPQLLRVIENGPATALATDGHYFFVPGYDEVLVFDVTQLGTEPEPEPIATIATEARFMALTLAADRLYIAGDESFEVWDIHDVTNAQRLGVAPTSKFPTSTVVAGRRALVTHNAYDAASMTEVRLGCLWPPGGGLRVVDLADESAPKPMPLLETPSQLMDIAVAGDHMIALDSAVNDPTGRLWVLDVHQPDQPRYVASLSLAGHARGLAVDATHAYVVETGVGFEVVDISDPLRPRHVGQLALSTDDDWVAVSGATVFTAELFRTGPIQVIDVSDPAHPRLLPSLPVEGPPGGLSAANGFLYALIYSSGNEATLQVYDASDPTHLRRTGSLAVKDVGWAPVADGQHVYLVTPDGGVSIVDVSDPTRPTIVGTAPGVDSCFSCRLTVAGGRAYVSGSAVAAFDISRPNAPRRLAEAETLTYGCSHAFASRLAAIGETLVTVGMIESAPMDLGLTVWRFGGR